MQICDENIVYETLRNCHWVSHVT